MQSFDDFISSVRVDNKLTKISNDLEGFIQDFEDLKSETIKQKLFDWLKNFKDFKGVNFNILLSILENISYNSDSKVDSAFRKGLMDFNKKTFSTCDLSNIFICPLGNNTESSFRISAKYNELHPPYLILDINDLLKKIQDNKKAVIVFVDDILQSGGQLISIFKKYLGEKLDDEDISDEYDNRIEIESDYLKQVFRNRKIIIFFYLNLFSGFVKANKKLKDELGIDIEIIPLNDVIFKGCFGTDNDIRNIIGNSPAKYTDLPLKDYSYKEVKPIYEILKEAGIQLLKNDREFKEKDIPEYRRWAEVKFENRALGYGNNAILQIGQQNVPTSTITALWLPTPGKINKPVIVKGQEILWKPLFYRKTKILVETNNGNVEEVYPKIQVSKVNIQSPQIDPYNYDLITLLCLSRKNSILIFGHEEKNIIELKGNLNKLEDELYFKFKSISRFSRREWFLFSINNIIEANEEIFQQLLKIKKNSIGIILKVGLKLNHTEISFLISTVDNIIKSFPTKIFSILIDFPTRNIIQLQHVQTALKQFDYPVTSYISNQLEYKVITQHQQNASFFDHNSDFGNIVFYLEKCLRTNENYTKIIEKLKSFAAIKSDIIDFSIYTDEFSPKGFIDDFVNIFAKNETNKSNWEHFYKDLIIICSKYTPEHIEDIVYWAASCTNDFIKFSTLYQVIHGRHDYLIDYWVEGSRCKIENFINIDNIISAPISYLMFPLLRYFNRHKSEVGANINVLNLIKDGLKGTPHNDYQLAEKILSNSRYSFNDEITSNYSGTIIKLMQCGVDIFENVDSTLLSSNIISQILMEKLILSSKMSSKKVDLIFSKHQYLIN